jgi:homoserine O-succinyltransferase
MIEILEWGRDNVCSVLCSCLATHAVFHHFHGIERVRLPHKRWGVYSHDVLDTSHPLVGDINTRFDAPHSHVYELSRKQMESAGARVLAHSVGAGAHLAVSEDGFRFVYFQGHPEYDTYSLLKEYKREVNRYNNKIHADYPPYPEHYFGRDTAGMLENYRVQAARARTTGRTPPEFPEDDITPLVHNTWTDTGKALFNNWLGLVYRLTDLDRRRPFMSGVDPDDPLDWRASRRA